MPRGSRGFRFTTAAAAAGGEINFPGDIGTALALSTVGDFTAVGDHTLDLDLSAVATLLSTTGISLGVTQLVSGTAGADDAALALGASTIANLTALGQHGSGTGLSHFVLTFAATPGASSVAETAVGGRTDWTGDANTTGAPDGSNATIAGNALGARGGQLEFGYRSYTGKDDFPVDQVQLHFYVEQTGTVLNNGDMQLKWRKVSTDGWTVLETITGNVSSLATPRTFDVTGSYTSPVPSDLDGIETAVYWSSDLGEALLAGACDAVTVEVNASLTEAL